MPYFKSDFENTDAYCTAIAENICPTVKITLKCGMFSTDIKVYYIEYYIDKFNQ